MGGEKISRFVRTFSGGGSVDVGSHVLPNWAAGPQEEEEKKRVFVNILGQIQKKVWEGEGESHKVITETVMDGRGSLNADVKAKTC